jgi:plasmid rolling circle replication initiator protein Rep
MVLIGRMRNNHITVSNNSNIFQYHIKVLFLHNPHLGRGNGG